ncbi:MAG TPA: AMP-binding protein, partial [Actinomycetota bacterium]
MDATARHDTFRAAGWWQGDTIHTLFERLRDGAPDRLAVADAPNREAFTHGAPARLTFAELDALVDRIAGGLLAGEVARGEVVAIQLPNVVELVASLLACSRIGAIASPLPIQFRAHEV